MQFQNFLDNRSRGRKNVCCNIYLFPTFLWWNVFFLWLAMNVVVMNGKGEQCAKNFFWKYLGVNFWEILRNYLGDSFSDILTTICVTRPMAGPEIIFKVQKFVSKIILHFATECHWNCLLNNFFKCPKKCPKNVPKTSQKLSTKYFQNCLQNWPRNWPSDCPPNLSLKLFL